MNTVNEIQILPEKLRKNGFDYTLVSRGVRSCLYAQHVTPKVTCYEVFLLRVRLEKKIFDRHYPSKEIFPGNEDFGTTAWAFILLERAQEKYEELENELN